MINGNINQIQVKLNPSKSKSARLLVKQRMCIMPIELVNRVNTASETEKVLFIDDQAPTSEKIGDAIDDILNDIGRVK